MASPAQGYEDEPISKILANIGESDTVLLDRWQLTVEPNGAAADGNNARPDLPHNAKPDLPLNVVNNYFSFGVDAHIALEFHEARGDNDNPLRVTLTNEAGWDYMKFLAKLCHKLADLRCSRQQHLFWVNIKRIEPQSCSRPPG